MSEPRPAHSSRATGVLGVDAGTSGCKAVVVSDAGAVLGTGWHGYATTVGPDRSVTQSPSDWLTAAAAAVRQAVAAAAPVDVVALALTAPAHNAVLLSEGNEPLADVMLWSDPRPAETARRMLRRYGDDLLRRTYVDLGPGWTLPQLEWIRQAHPELWSRTRRVLIGKDFLRAAFTGEAATDPSDAAGTALYDPSERGWCEDLLADLGLTVGQLPAIRGATDVAGRLTAEWAARLGLAAGTPVAVGATDTAAELVSVGATAPGDGVVKVASTGTVVTVTADARPRAGVLTYPHAADGLWYALTATNTAATALQWLRSQLLGGADDPSDLDLLLAEAATVAPGAEGLRFFPYLNGERCPLWDASATAAFVGLTSRHQRRHLVRAVMEGVAYSLRDCWRHLDDAAAAPREPVLTGGGLRSALWRSIVTSVLGVTGRVRRPCEPAAGAALLAATAVGMDVEPALEEDTTIAPDPATSPEYERRYRSHLDLLPRITDISHRLSAGAAAAAPARPAGRRADENAPPLSLP